MAEEVINHKEKNSLWKVVEKIILDNYDFVRTMKMRNSFYYLRRELSSMIGNEISEKQYKHFLERYDYYQADKWPAWERKHGIRRPICKDPTYAVYNGETISLAYIDSDDFYFHRCQGFMFIEKSGFTEDLKMLSSNGWVILAGQGHISREAREQMYKKYPEKPILVIHDFDYAGESMPDVFEKGSQRTKHLNLTFDNVIDLGLREEDVEELNLPIEPESEKFSDKRDWRVELDALIILRLRDKIENPLLWYVTKRMKEEGIPLHREEQSSIEALRWGIEFRIKREFESIIKSRVDEILENVFDDKIIELALPEEKGEDLSQFEEIIFEMAEYYLDGAEYIDKEEIVSGILDITEVEPDGKNFIRRTPRFVEN